MVNNVGWRHLFLLYRWRKDYRPISFWAHLWWFARRVWGDYWWIYSVAGEPRWVVRLDPRRRPYPQSACRILSYQVAKEYRGHGWGTHAIRWVTDLPFNGPYHAYVDADNIASQRCFEKNGWRRITCASGQYRYSYLP